jgi:chemotaxis protein MotA
VIIGYIVVLGSVFGGFMLVGGELGALYQPAELLIIGGAGIGAFFVGNNGKAIKSTMRAMPQLFRASKYNKALYMDLMALLYRLLAKSRQQGCCRWKMTSTILQKVTFSLIIRASLPINI